MLIWANSLSGYCETWDQGLNYSIDFNDQYCQIQKPKYCWNIYFDGLFDLSRFHQCEIKDEKLLKKSIKSFYDNYSFNPKDNIQFLGWPHFQDLAVADYLTETKMCERVIKNSQRYDTLQAAIDDKREIIIDVPNQKMHINMERKEKEVKKRQKIKNKGMAKNIIMIFMDTVSRQQFIRKLPKTAQFLKRYGNIQSQEQEDLQAKSYEFFRYHSIDKITFNNEYVMSFNETLQDYMDSKRSKYNKRESILKKFKKTGYMVGYTTNGAGLYFPIKTTRQVYGEQIYKYYEVTRGDHEFNFYDPQYISHKSYMNFYQGTNSLFRRCAYGNDTNYFMFEYAKKFMETYKDDKKVMYLEFQDSHEATTEVLQYMDNNYYSFLVYLEQQGFLQKDTMLFNFADHGNHFSQNPMNQEQCQKGACKLFDNYTQERMLPAIFIIISKNILDKYSQFGNTLIQEEQQDNQKQQKKSYLHDTLMHNQQPIFSVWQLHNTAMCAANGIQQQYCQNSLFYPLEEGRSCKDIKMSILEDDEGNDINDDFCVCYPQNQN